MRQESQSNSSNSIVYEFNQCRNRYIVLSDSNEFNQMQLSFKKEMMILKDKTKDCNNQSK